MAYSDVTPEATKEASTGFKGKAIFVDVVEYVLDDAPKYRAWRNIFIKPAFIAWSCSSDVDSPPNTASLILSIIEATKG